MLERGHPPKPTPTTKAIHLLLEVEAALFGDIEHVEHGALQVGQRGDGLHLDGVALLGRGRVRVRVRVRVSRVRVRVRVRVGVRVSVGSGRGLG